MLKIKKLKIDFPLIFFLFSFLLTIQFQNIIIIYNFFTNSLEGDLLLSYSGLKGYREDVLFYLSYCKNIINGKNFFEDQGLILPGSTLAPMPYLQIIFCNLVSILTLGNDNIFMIIIYLVPFLSFLILIKVFSFFTQKNYLKYVFTFFSLAIVYEVYRFPSPSITYMLFLYNLYLILKLEDNQNLYKFILPITFVAVQPWIYFYNFVVLAPIIVIKIANQFIYKNYHLKKFKILIFYFAIISSIYFIFSYILSNSLSADFYNKIIWTKNISEMKYYNINTIIDGRYLYLLIIVCIFLFILTINKAKQIEVKKISALINIILVKKENFALIILSLFLSVFFPKILELTINFPQPQNLFYRIGVFQLSISFCLVIFYFLNNLNLNKISSFFSIYKFQLLFITLVLLSNYLVYKNIKNNVVSLDPNEYTIQDHEKKIINFIKNQNLDNCVVLSDDYKIGFLIKSKTKCKIIKSNIFDSNVSFDELIERYVLSDVFFGKKNFELLSNFDLYDKKIEDKISYCSYILNASRTSYVNQIFHFGLCNPKKLKSKILFIEEKINKNLYFFVEKYKINYVVNLNKKNSFSYSKELIKTKIENLYLIK